MVVLTATDVGMQITGKRKTSLLKNERKYQMKNLENCLESLKAVPQPLGKTGDSLRKLYDDLVAEQESTLAIELASEITSYLSSARQMLLDMKSLATKLESLKTNESLTSPNTSTVDE